MSVGAGQEHVLRQARRRDSLTKRQRVLDTIVELERNGEAITFAAVARQARVSTWLVYADGIREHIAAARDRHTIRPRSGHQTSNTPSPAGLRTDLELARAEIVALRAERDQLRAAMRQQLGRELDALSSAGVADRIEELTRHNRRLAEQNQQFSLENEAARTRVDELETDLAAARTSLRRMIREQNAPTQ